MMRTLVSFLLLSASLAAQSATIDVPAYASQSEGGSVFGSVGIHYSGRMQFILDADHASALRNRRIVGISFRRDTDDDSRFVAGRSRLRVTLGAAACSSGDASEDFAMNISGPTLVFSGTVDAPESPASGFQGWVASHTVHIALQRPYDHVGGGIVVDVSGEPDGGVWDWPFDGVADHVSGSVLRVGSACGATANVLGSTANVQTAGLVPGDTAIVTCWGESGSAAQLVLGLDMLPLPLDLGFLGVPGCELYVSPIASLPGSFSTTEFGGAAPGRAFLPLRIPNANELLDARLTMQWFEIGRSFAASEALDCRIAARTRSLGIATVWAKSGSASGIVYLDRAPVIRFHVE